MSGKEEDKALEQALAQMLRPVKGIPFPVIIKSLSGQEVIPMNKENASDLDLLKNLENAIQSCITDLKSNPIKRSRPNEVGNAVEAYVMRALSASGLMAARPTSRAGLGKPMGYPDILIHDREKRATYVECKIFAHGSAETTMRSFYLSPSESSFKVSFDARHLLLAFGMEATPVAGSRDSLYLPKSYKLTDLHDLLCDVKYEFNSSNRRLYSPAMILSQGTF